MAVASTQIESFGEPLCPAAFLSFPPSNSKQACASGHTSGVPSRTLAGPTAGGMAQNEHHTRTWGWSRPKWPISSISVKCSFSTSLLMLRRKEKAHSPCIQATWVQKHIPLPSNSLKKAPTQHPHYISTEQMCWQWNPKIQCATVSIINRPKG